MNKFSQNLGFRLIASSILLAVATIFVAGYVVYKRSQVAIVDSALHMVREVALTVAQVDSAVFIDDYLQKYLTSKSGGAWLMDSDGEILASTDPALGGSVSGEKPLSRTVFRLQFAQKFQRFDDSKRTDVHLVTPLDIMARYEEGIAEYDYKDATRIVAFKVIPGKNWLLGIDKPVGTAYSELDNIKKYIVIVCIISIAMVSVFSWLAITRIIQPYYKDVEDLNARLSDSVRKLSALHRVGKSLQRVLPPHDLLRESMKGVAEALGYERILVYLGGKDVQSARLEMILENGEALSPDRAPEEARVLSLDRQNGILERALIEQRPYIIRDPLTSDLVDGDKARILGLQEFAVVPLVAESKCIGVIAVDNPLSKKHIRNEDIDTLATFADHAGLAIESARLHTELQNYAYDLAATDSLTGLSNRSHFATWLEAQMADSRREGKDFSIVFIQAHSLREINQEFGYAAGNIALRRLGQMISASLVGESKAARLGGGEFVVGLPAHCEDFARKAAEELEQRVRDFRFTEEGLEKAPLRITVVHGGLRDDKTPEEFLERMRRLVPARGAQ
ncbi:diguanylate cyclase [Candidatus Poribacteria bacterium]|nr:diguanylate cyclase [Candidatus Poribacteria bacterium]